MPAPNANFESRTPIMNWVMHNLGATAATWEKAALDWGDFAVELTESIAKTTALQGSYNTQVQSIASVHIVEKLTQHLQWLGKALETAVENGLKCQNVVACFMQSQASMVPPPQVIRNRTMQLQAMATNFLGQNNQIISQLEKEYQQIWKHNASVLKQYDKYTDENTRLKPMEPPQKLLSKEAEIKQYDKGLQSEAKQAGSLGKKATSATKDMMKGGQQMSQLMNMFMQAGQQAPKALQQAGKPVQDLAKQVQKVPQQIMQSVQQGAQGSSASPASSPQEFSSDGLDSSLGTSFGGGGGFGGGGTVSGMPSSLSQAEPKPTGRTPSGWNVMSASVPASGQGAGLRAAPASPTNAMRAGGGGGGMYGGGAARGGGSEKSREVNRQYLEDVEAFDEFAHQEGQVDEEKMQQFFK